MRNVIGFDAVIPAGASLSQSIGPFDVITAIRPGASWPAGIDMTFQGAYEPGEFTNLVTDGAEVVIPAVASTQESAYSDDFHARFLRVRRGTSAAPNTGVADITVRVYGVAAGTL